MSMPSKEQVDALVANIHVMKPATINRDNPKEVLKLDALLEDDDFVAEEKIDGAHYLNIANRFYSKDHIDKTENFPHLVAGLTKLNFPALILDGEIFYPGKTSEYVNSVVLASPTQALVFQKENGWIKYKVFDILRAPNGQWLNNTPQEKRRAILERLFQQYIKVQPELANYLELVPMTEKNKREFKDNILAAGGEGVVLKKKDSLYMFGKKPKWVWMKWKQTDETDMFIIGYKEPTVYYNGSDYANWPYWRQVDGELRAVSKAYFKGWIGSLILGGYVNGEVKTLCSVSGLSDTLCEKITQDPEAYINKVVKMRYMELTSAGNFRHPTFIDFHEDKTPEECKFTPEGSAVMD